MVHLDLIFYDDRLQFGKISLIFIFIIGFSGILGLFLRRYLHVKLLIIISSLVFNTVIYYTDYTEYFRTSLMSAYFPISPRVSLMYYFPIYIASVCLKCESADIKSVLPYSILVCGLEMVLAIFNGYILQSLTTLKWTSYQMFIFGVSTCCFQPDPFANAPKSKRFLTLNQLALGEYIGTMTLSLTIVRSHIDGVTPDWQSFFIKFPFEVIWGIGLGLISGYLFALTLRITYDEARPFFLVTLCSMMCMYYVATYCAVSPFITILFMVPSFINIKKGYSSKANEDINDFFKFASLLLDILLFCYLIYLSVYVVIYNNRGDSNIQISYCIFGFFCVYLTRSLVFLTLCPLIKRLNKTLDNVVIVVNSWASITSNTALIISFMFYYNEDKHAFSLIILCQVCFSVVATNIINPIAMEFLIRNKFTTAYTSEQAANINVCLHEIRSLRVKYIYVWKMKGVMTDARWDIVKNVTNIFQSSKTTGTGDIEMWRNVTCPDCGREIHVQQPIKDVDDYTRIKKKLIQNQLKTILTRRLRFGLLTPTASKQSIKLGLQSLTFEKHVQHETYKPYLKMKGIAERLYTWKQNALFKHHFLKRIPRKPIRAKFYYFVRSTFFTYFILILNSSSVILLIASLFITNFNSVYFYLVIISSKLYMFVMMFNMFVYIQSYSIYSLRQGTKSYFMSSWHRIEFVMLVVAFVDLIVILVLYFRNDIDHWHLYKYLRLVKVADLVSACKIATPILIRSMEDWIVGRLMLGYEITKAIYDAYSELELRMDFIFDQNIQMALECQKWIREDKRELYDIFTYIQYKYPYVTRKVKTRQIINATLTALYMTLEDIRTSGYIDLTEYNILKKKLGSCARLGRSLENSLVRIQSKEILNNVPWIINIGHEIEEFFWSTCTLRLLKTGDVLFKPGEAVNGVFIVIAGMLKMSYNPTTQIISNLLRHGLLPVCTFSDNMQFFEPMQQTLVMGNSIGEICMALNRPADSKLEAVKPSKLYFVHQDAIRIAEAHLRDKVHGILSRMMKSSCFNITISILKTLPKYEFYTQHDIKMKVESAFVPDLSNYRVLSFPDAIDDLVLLHGAVRDYYSHTCLIAPCYIPRSMTKFYMHEQHPSSDNLVTSYDFIEAKLIVIPMQDIDQYTVMKLLNEFAEMYPNTEPIQIVEKHIDPQKNPQLSEPENRLGFAALKAVTQGTHLTKFINLKK